MSFIPFLEGKKVYTPDGIFVGIIKKVYISEFGTHTAVIQTNFKELPEFEVIVTSLRHTKITRGGKTEEAYILKEVPIKIRIIIDELKQKYIPTQQVPRKIEQRKIPLPTATQTQTTPPTQPATREIAKELLERRRTTTESKPEISALPTYKKIIQTPKAPMPVGPYSQAIKAGNFLFVSGQIPIDPRNGNIVRGPLNIQVRYVMENIKNILEAAGYTLEDVVMVYVYLKDISKFNEFNKIYEQYFAKSKPARVTVEVSRIPKDVDVEISVIAYKE